ncbi:Uncharacterized conserved protein YndB, AHSA1/START domain [Reichenbachiella faecimaris]|uniref:Uncharacterized conserved protein YndB, AHSA1/START domain n=1 Tax=Reichenbachiella faecimaris TaxID=692418 RepID=A0A1W2GM15_REIFA|nr:SRPBCC domain-containing protein [Reichenbachiella faecimaris]SMD37687.1 Uncharacterized conserved protein YndB, AHSA1/START domain [Reichenbachiella faecimaris]
MKKQPSKQTDRLVLSREFNAPKELIFNAFSTSEALNEWWGPAESENTVMGLDFRPGGVFHFKMNFQGNIMYGRFLYKKIEPHDYLEFTNAFADEHANVVPAPFDKNFPLEVLYRLEFIEKEKGKTTLNLTGEPLDPTSGELEAFNSLMPSMNEGFAKTWDKLQSYLEKSL